jgi:hypothetical protein
MKNSLIVGPFGLFLLPDAHKSVGIHAMSVCGTPVAGT